MNTNGKNGKSNLRLIRESLKLSREKASEIIGGITPERLERIENGKFEPVPWEIAAMAKAYNAPELRNYYCANKCAIGKEFVEEIQMKGISQIVLEILNSINTLNDTKERLVQIAVDEVIDDDEIEDFVKIEKELERISSTVDSMKLWIEKKLNTEQINKEKYHQLKNMNN